MRRQTLAAAAAFAVAFGFSARAQQPPTPASQPAAPSSAKVPAPVLLKVQFVISRYQGEKKISGQPYTLIVRANEPRTNLRMGLQVPVPTFPDNKMLVVYKDVGTSIDCGAQALDDGRFRLDVSLEDSSLAADDQGTQATKGVPPQIRAFRLSNETVVLKDGQTAQLTTAAEKSSGEITRVDVTLNVVK